MHTKIAWGVIAFVIIAGGAYAYMLSQKAPAPGTTKEQPVPTIILQGTIIDVNADKLQITVQASSTSPAKTVTVSPATKIERVISQKDAQGAVEKQSLTEVDIGEVKKGSPVTITYQSEKDGVLSGVSEIVFSVEGSLDMNQTAQPIASVYMKSEIVAVDLAKNIITYKPYVFATVGATTASTTVSAGIKVYRVDNPLRLSILHARTAAALADLQTGQTVFFTVAEKTLKEGKIVPSAVIIIGK